MIVIIKSVGAEVGIIGFRNKSDRFTGKECDKYTSDIFNWIAD